MNHVYGYMNLACRLDHDNLALKVDHCTSSASAMSSHDSWL